MNAKSVIKFLAFIVVFGVVGWFFGLNVGRVLASGQEMPNFDTVVDFIAYNNMAIQGALLIVLGAPGHYYYQKGKKLSKNMDDDEAFEQGENALSKSVMCWSVLMVTSATLFGIFTTEILQLAKNSDIIHLVTALFAMIVVVGYAIVYEVKTVELAKKRNPTRKGNPLELRFQKDWMSSMDEAEKYVAYFAAYKSFRATRTALLIAWMTAVLSGMIFATGPFPVVLVGVLWIVHTVTYQKACSEAPQVSGKL